MRNTITLALLFALLSGCVAVQVSSFHELEKPLSGTTYAFVPIKEQDGSLEFKTYAKLVKAELDKRGMVETTREQAQYAILMTYGVDDGKQVVSSYPIYGQTGTVSSSTVRPYVPSINAGSSRTTGTITSYGGNIASYSSTTTYTPDWSSRLFPSSDITFTPTYGIVGSGTKTTTEYARNLSILIVDNTMSSDSKPHYVYKGIATSSGSTNQLAQIMPAMVSSVFEDFPGKSGSSKKSLQWLKE